MRDHLQVVWDILQEYRVSTIPEGYEDYDAQWQDICETMAKIHEGSLVFYKIHEELDVLQEEIE